MPIYCPGLIPCDGGICSLMSSSFRMATDRSMVVNGAGAGRSSRRSSDGCHQSRLLNPDGKVVPTSPTFQ